MAWDNLAEQVRDEFADHDMPTWRDVAVWSRRQASERIANRDRMRRQTEQRLAASLRAKHAAELCAEAEGRRASYIATLAAHREEATWQDPMQWEEMAGRAE